MKANTLEALQDIDWSRMKPGTIRRVERVMGLTPKVTEGQITAALQQIKDNFHREGTPLPEELTINGRTETVKAWGKILEDWGLKAP